MHPIVKQQLSVLQGYERYREASATELPTGAHLIEVRNVPMPPGWNRTGSTTPLKAATILFLAPTGYPSARPDCFWIEVQGLRFNGEGTPQNVNETNPIPGVPARPVTWFSWHIQDWNPNHDSLATYLSVIMQRLKPAR